MFHRKNIQRQKIQSNNVFVKKYFKDLLSDEHPSFHGTNVQDSSHHSPGSLSVFPWPSVLPSFCVSVVHSVQVSCSLSVCKQTPRGLMWPAKGSVCLADKAQKAAVGGWRLQSNDRGFSTSTVGSCVVLVNTVGNSRCWIQLVSYSAWSCRLHPRVRKSCWALWLLSSCPAINCNVLMSLSHITL